MPIYQYIDHSTAERIEVVRTFEEWEAPPTREEAHQWTDEEYQNASWERVIGVPGVVKGQGWGGGKGNWIWLVAAPVTWASLLCHNISLG